MTRSTRRVIAEGFVVAMSMSDPNLDTDNRRAVNTHRRRGAEDWSGGAMNHHRGGGDIDRRAHGHGRRRIHNRRMAGRTMGYRVRNHMCGGQSGKNLASGAPTVIMGQGARSAPAEQSNRDEQCR